MVRVSRLGELSYLRTVTKHFAIVSCDSIKDDEDEDNSTLVRLLTFGGGFTAFALTTKDISI